MNHPWQEAASGPLVAAGSVVVIVVVVVQVEERMDRIDQMTVLSIFFGA